MPAPTVMFDTPCPACGYNLRGIPQGSPCPECGARAAPPAPLPAAVSSQRATAAFTAPDRMLDAPMRSVAALGLGYTLMACGALAAPALALAGVGLAHLNLTPHLTLSVAGITASALWLAGIALVCQPRPSTPGRPRDRAEGRRLRVTVFAMQAAWLGAAALLLIVERLLPLAAAPSPGLVLALRIAAGLLAVVGLAGLLPLGLLMAADADWGEDERLARRLRSALWCVCVFGGLTIIGWSLPGILGRPLFIAFGWILHLLAVGGLLVLVLSSWSLSRLCRAAYLSARWRVDKDARLRERMAREAEAHRADLRDAPEPETPSMFHKVGVAPRPGQRR